MDRRAALAAIQKATITTEVGGQLNPEQAKAFVQAVMENSTFGSQIDYEQRTATQGTIEKMGNGSRLIRGAKENSDDGYRAGIGITEAKYQTSKLWLPYEVTEDFFRHNIEGQAVEPKVVKRMTQQFGNDLDDLNINGDEADVSEEADFIALDDGLLTKLEAEGSGAHRVDVTKVKGADGKALEGKMASEVFFAGKYAMPDKYVNSGRLKWLCSPNRWTTWIQSLIGRPTGAGDAALTAKELYPLGIPPIVAASSTENPNPMPGVPFFPDDRMVLCDPKNLTRIITWDIRSKRVTGDTDWGLATRDKRGYVFFLEQDFVIKEEDAIVDLHGFSAITPEG